MAEEKTMPSSVLNPLKIDYEYFSPPLTIKFKIFFGANENKHVFAFS